MMIREEEGGNKPGPEINDRAKCVHYLKSGYRYLTFLPFFDPTGGSSLGRDAGYHISANTGSADFIFNCPDKAFML